MESMFFRAQILLLGLLALALGAWPLMADPGDLEGSRDYPGFPRLPTFVITDYDEDNPSDYDFPVARPLPTDASHVALVHVKGHRYIIRYASNSEIKHSIFEAQQYYEKLAADVGYTVEKTGAVGDVSETFRLKKPNREVWVHLEPGVSVYVLTIVEASGEVQTPAQVALEDPLYAGLMKTGHVVLPLNFLPGKPDIDADSRLPLDRVVKIMQRHPNLQLTIEGHTDNTGNVQENIILSTKRAQAVRLMLISDGVDKDRLTAAGFGGTEPIADNSTAEGRARNRRIELVVQKN